jgi:hypothetical protein
MSGTRAELAAFLRSRRAQLRPVDVGLPADPVPGRRRTPGLRREEVAELPVDRRNLLWMMFTDAENRARMTNWKRAARVLLSQFRAAAGRRAGDPRFAELVAALTEASPDFREWWADYPVRYFRPGKIGLDHPRAGKITLELFQLRRKTILTCCW